MPLALPLSRKARLAVIDNQPFVVAIIAVIIPENNAEDSEMAITLQDLENACRDTTEQFIFKGVGNLGWLPSLQKELQALATPSIANLPAAVERIAFINTLMSLVSSAGDLKRIKGNGQLDDLLTKPTQLTLKLIEWSWTDIKNRINGTWIGWTYCSPINSRISSISLPCR